MIKNFVFIPTNNQEMNKIILHAIQENRIFTG